MVGKPRCQIGVAIRAIDGGQIAGGWSLSITPEVDQHGTEKIRIKKGKKH